LTDWAFLEFIATVVFVVPLSVAFAYLTWASGMGTMMIALARKRGWRNKHDKAADPLEEWNNQFGGQ
jgi:hypothetical protein